MTAKKRTAKAQRAYATTRRRATTQPTDPTDVLTALRTDDDAVQEPGAEPGADAYEYSAADDEPAHGNGGPPTDLLVWHGVDLTKLFRRDAIAATTAAYVRAPSNGVMVPSKTVLEVTLASGQVWYVCAWPGGCNRGPGPYGPGTALPTGTPYVSENVRAVISHQSTHSDRRQQEREAAAQRAVPATTNATRKTTRKTTRRYNTGVRQAVLEFITEHRDNPVTVRTIAGHTRFPERSVQAALRNMRHEDEGRRHLQTYRRNRIQFWVWSSNVPAGAATSSEPQPIGGAVDDDVRRRAYAQSLYDSANAGALLRSQVDRTVHKLQREQRDRETFTSQLEKDAALAQRGLAAPAPPTDQSPAGTFAELHRTASELFRRANVALNERWERQEFGDEDREPVRQYEDAMRQVSKPNDVANVEGGHQFTYVGKTSQGVMLVREESSGVIYRVVEL